MNIKINSALKHAISNFDLSPDFDWYCDLIAPLRNLIDEGITISIATDCIYFKNRRDNESPELIDSIEDHTGIECFINEVSIDDYIDDRDELLKQGLSFSLKLAEKLKDLSPRKFKVLLTYDYYSCTVRFHRDRDGEAWLDENIDSYDDGVLIIGVE